MSVLRKIAEQSTWWFGENFGSIFFTISAMLLAIILISVLIHATDNDALNAALEDCRYVVHNSVEFETEIVTSCEDYLVVRKEELSKEAQEKVNSANNVLEKLR